jgi:hypothetical protein
LLRLRVCRLDAGFRLAEGWIVLARELQGIFEHEQ